MMVTESTMIEQARRAAVFMPTNRRKPGLEFGSGGTLAVSRPEGNKGIYVVTNAHVVTNYDGKLPTPNGTLIDGEYYHAVRDYAGRYGFARLVSYSAGGICSADRFIAKAQPLHDFAVLEVLDARYDPAMFARAHRRLDPRGYAATQRGDADPHDARRFAPEPYALEEAAKSVPQRAGTYVMYGYPGDRGGGPEWARGSYRLMQPAPQYQPIMLHYRGTRDNMRDGYSGSLLIDRTSGLPIGLAAASYNDMPQGKGVPIGAVTQRIAHIEALRAVGQRVTVTPQLPLCENGKPEAWIDATIPQPAPGDEYAARLQSAVADYLAGADQQTATVLSPVLPAAPMRPAAQRER